MSEFPIISSQVEPPALAKPVRSPLGFVVPPLWLSVPLVLIFFYLAEMSTRIGMDLPVCYIVALVLVIALPGIREKILAGATCTLLMIVDYYHSSPLPGVPSWIPAVNHGLATAMMWVVTGLGIRHRRVEDVMQTNERLANERLALINTVYASAPVGLCFVDRELRYVSANNALAEMMGRSVDSYLGKTVREATPELADSMESRYRHVIATGQTVVDAEVSGCTQHHGNERRYWLCSYYPVNNESGELLGVNVAVRDITRRKQAEGDTLFLLDLGECIRFAVDAEELLWAVAVALGEHLQANRCGFLEIHVQEDRFTAQRDYHPHLPSLAGSYRLSEFSPAIIAAGKSGQATAVNDVAADSRTVDFLDTYRDLGVGAFVSAPLLRNGELTSALVVASVAPHHWTEREITLVNVVAERTWLAVEKLRLDNALRESDQALRDADQRKDEFLATLAHELRNPLSLIRNVVTLQNTPDAAEYDSQWAQDVIDRQVNYLTRLTDDLFDVSRITRNKLELQKEQVNLADIIRSAVESTRPLIDQRQHQLTVTMTDVPIYVDADRVRLIQVFMNLLNNAAKYTPDPGRIWLHVEQEGDVVVVRVKDTGIGISAESLPHLFELFYQVDRSFTRAEGGLGLGLTLVHRLVEMHGGKIEAKSEGLMRGSEFIVRLPALTRQMAIPVDRENFARDASGWTPCHRILVADDFPQSAATLARLLERDGSEVRIALDGIEAVEVAEQFRPDIAVLDIAMPKLNGFEAARKIRQQPWGKNVVLIALTGWGQQQDRERTQEAGFDAHLTKPVSYETITELLAKLAAASKLRSNRGVVP